MNVFRDLLTPFQEQLLRALDAWHRALENRALRMDCPDAYHEELVRQTDEMDRLKIVTWSEWRDLRMEADRADMEAVAGGDYHSRSESRLEELEDDHRPRDH